MKIFLNAQFTGLIKNASLISIGLVSEYEDHLYIELNDFDKTLLVEWLLKNIIPSLKYRDDLSRDLSLNYICDSLIDFKNPFQTTREIRTKYKSYVEDSYPIDNLIIDWIEKITNSSCSPVEMISDCKDYNWVLFCDLFGGALSLPKRISPYCHDINQDIAKFLDISNLEAFYTDRESFSQVELRDAAKYGIKESRYNALWEAFIIKKCQDKIKENEDFISLM